MSRYHHDHMSVSGWNKGSLWTALFFWLKGSGHQPQEKDEEGKEEKSP